MADYENPGANYMDVATQFEQGKAYFQSGDYDQAERCLQAPARKGNRGAQMLLAYLYEVSEAHRDQEKAIFWYEQAAARGEFAAVDALIRLYRAAGKSKADKLRYWEEKKLKNDDKKIGMRYGAKTADAKIEVRPLTAKTSERSKEAKPAPQVAVAKKVKTKSAASQPVAAEPVETKVAPQPVLETKTVKTEPPEGSMWYYRGEDYFYGRSGMKDRVKGVECYHKAAELGHAEAQYKLGNCYSLGDGVDKDMKEAMKWYQKACDQGLECAKTRLSVLQKRLTESKVVAPVVLETKTVKAEPPEGSMWYYRGEDYFYGRSGMKDRVKGVECYHKAAELGYAEAQYMLGNCYSLGDGVDKDMEEAVKWYQKACDQGLECAKTRLAVLQKRLSEPKVVAPVVLEPSVDSIPVKPVQPIPVVSQDPQPTEKEPVAKEPVNNDIVSKRVNTPKVTGNYAELVRFVAFAQNVGPLAGGNFGLEITYDAPRGSTLTNTVWATFKFCEFNEIQFARYFTITPSVNNNTGIVHKYYNDICEKAGLAQSDWPFGIDKYDFVRVLQDEFYDMFKVIPDDHFDDVFTFKVKCGVSSRNALIVYNEVENMLKTYFPKIQAKKVAATATKMVIAISNTKFK